MAFEARTNKICVEGAIICRIIVLLEEGLDLRSLEGTSRVNQDTDDSFPAGVIGVSQTVTIAYDQL